MARKNRSDLPDGLFHVMCRSIEGQKLFRSDGDHMVYLDLLAEVVQRRDWRLLTFVLMGNHVHLLVDAPTSELSAGLWWINWRFAEYYKNHYSPRFGHVFGGRPKTKPVMDDSYCLAVMRYIARNPVGVYGSRPEDYRWSAHRAIVGAAPAFPGLDRRHLLGWFPGGDAVGQYERFVTGDPPDAERGVRQWAEGLANDRPRLSELVADPTPEALLIARRRWGYGERAISRTTGLSRATVRSALARAGSG